MKPQRILFAAEFWDGASAAGIVGGLRHMKHAVSQIDWNDYIGGAGLAGRIKTRLLLKHQIAQLNRAILKAADAGRPDVFITVKGSFIDAQTIAALQAKGTTCANFYPDVSFDHPGLSYNAIAAYDLIATTKSYHLPYLNKEFGNQRHCFIPHGYSPAVHAPVDLPATDDDYDWDICYIGNPSPSKVDWLDSLCSAFLHCRIAIVGNRWGRFAKSGKLTRAVLLPAATGTAYARVACRSKINLGIHYGSHGYQGWEDKVSTRSFELPACKGFMLHIDNDEIRDLYKVGCEIDVFSNVAQLRERIGHYLDRPAKRREMLTAAFARCVPAYSLHSRAQELMDAIAHI